MPNAIYNLAMLESYIEQLAVGMPLTGACKLAAQKYGVMLSSGPIFNRSKTTLSNTRLDVYAVLDSGSRGSYIGDIIVRQAARHERGARHG